MIMTSEQWADLTIAQKMVEIVKRDGDATFVSFSRKIGDEAKGDYWIYHPERNLNVVLWAGASESLCDAVNSTLADKLLHWVPTAPLVYLADGGALSLPVAKSYREYKKEHWLPVIFHLGPYDGETELQ